MKRRVALHSKTDILYRVTEEANGNIKGKAVELFPKTPVRLLLLWTRTHLLAANPASRAPTDGSRDTKKVPLKSFEVELEVRDHVATVVSTLNYENKEDKPLEAVFVFPLPGDAAVCHFSAQVGQTQIVAELKEKQKVVKYLNTDPTQATVKLAAGHKFDRDVELLIYYKDAHQPTAVVETMAEALKKVEKMKADLGGTKILELLKHIYCQPCIQNQPRQVFLFWDWGRGQLCSHQPRKEEVTLSSSQGLTGCNQSDAVAAICSAADCDRHLSHMGFTKGSVCHCLSTNHNTFPGAQRQQRAV
ncbi:unnamed protein product [Oreochromis niloticus]|nr:unnamed protein product [Mustela putorius furo]